MNWDDRLSVVSNIKQVEEVVSFDDSDGSAKDAINVVRKRYPVSHIVFANGGDRTKTNIPEMDTEDKNVSFVFGVGGEDKLNSSSWIISKWTKEQNK